MRIDPQSWPTISELLDECLDLPEEARPAWLERLGPEYTLVLPELRELLSMNVTKEFLSTLPRITIPASAPGANRESNSPLTAGTMVGPYQLTAELGHGGMGMVYRAIDPRMGRDVAVKISAGRFSKRFSREVRAAAALNHPNVCQLYDVGPNFLVMELVEGETLSERIQRGKIPVEEALGIARQIADALAAVHERGIVHCDLKPGNIKIKPDGAVKLLDFGLAERTLVVPDAVVSETQAGAILGTLAYMSPEQAGGKPVDARSDIFSFGLVLYEMLGGRRLFPRNDPPPLPAPPEIVRIVTRCLRQDPAERFQSAREAKTALEQVSGKPAEPEPSIAVLPFVNMSAERDDDYFSDGLSDEIINTLAGIPGLKVTARTSAFSFRGKERDIRKIGDELGVRTVLEGAVRRAGSRIRVTAKLINAADGYHLWSERYDRELTDVFAVQDEIAAAIAGALQVRLSRDPGAFRRHKPDLPAYEAFLKGRHHLFKATPESLSRAKEYFEQAIALDPEYPEPQHDLGLYYMYLSMAGVRSLIEMAPLIRAQAQTALRLDPSMVRAHALFGFVAAAHDYDWTEAEQQFGLAMAATPVPVDVFYSYTLFYLTPVGRVREALEQMDKMLDPDPLSAFLQCNLGSVFWMAGMPERALQQVRKALEIDENYWIAHFNLGSTYILRGMFAEAIAPLEKAYQLAPWNSSVAGLYAGVLRRTGNRELAEQLIGPVMDVPSLAAPLGMVFYHSTCLETDAAADWFERAIENRDPWALLHVQLPETRTLRESSRWPALACRMNLPVNV